MENTVTDILVATVVIVIVTTVDAATTSQLFHYYDCDSIALFFQSLLDHLQGTIKLHFCLRDV